MIDDTNSITNYRRFHVRDIHAVVRGLSPEHKQRLTEQIQLQKGICNLMGQAYNTEDCKRIEKLLNEKEPRKEEEEGGLI